MFALDACSGFDLLAEEFRQQSQAAGRKYQSFSTGRSALVFETNTFAVDRASSEQALVMLTVETHRSNTHNTRNRPPLLPHSRL